MKRILASGAAAALVVLAIVFYLDWRIPRATATVQIHPSQLVSVLSNDPDQSGLFFRS